MSIIYDALKKVEASGVDDSKTKLDKGIDRGIKSKPKIYLLYALMVCLGFFIANFFYRMFIPKHLLHTSLIAIKSQPLIDKKQEATTLETSPSIETGTETKKETPALFNLNGVFFSEDEGYALINNKIVKQGDKIDGATIVRITLDEVELDSGGTIIKLSTGAR